MSALNISNLKTFFHELLNCTLWTSLWYLVLSLMAYSEYINVNYSTCDYIDLSTCSILSGKETSPGFLVQQIAESSSWHLPSNFVLLKILYIVTFPSVELGQYRRLGLWTLCILWCMVRLTWHCDWILKWHQSGRGLSFQPVRYKSVNVIKCKGYLNSDR